MQNRDQISPTPTDVGLVVSTLCKCPVCDDENYSNKSNQGNRSMTTQWRKGWDMIQEAATVPSSKEEHNYDDKAAFYANIIPIKAYNDVLDCMKKDKRWKESIRCLRWMEQGGKRSLNDTGTSPKIIMQSNIGSDRTSKPLGFFIPTPTLSIYQTVMECCLENQQLDTAVQILYDVTKTTKWTPKASTFQVVLAALSKKLQWREAVQLLDFMIERDIPRTVVTYNTVISACAKAREVGMAKSLLHRMKQRDNIQPDEISFNSVIGACANTARWKDALDVLDQCYREPGVTPNIFIYTNAMRACARGRQSSRALNLLQVVKDKGLPLDCYCYTAVIDACSKGGLWKKALALFDEMDEKGIEPTEVTYSVTISALGNGLQWERALQLLNQMRQKNMNVNLITYNAAITACARCARNCSKDYSKLGTTMLEREELWPKVLDLIDQMKQDGLEPDGFCYSSAINCCGAEGRWQEACDIIDVMKQGGPKTRPNKIAYTAAIGACGRAGQAIKALELFDAMKTEGLVPDRVAFNALFSALRMAKKPDKTFELWNELCQMSLTTSRRVKSNDPRLRDHTFPDIITISECISTLSDAGRVHEMDEVFEEAVNRGIVLRNNALDEQWEVDLSGMSFPLARAACRYLIKTMAAKRNQIEEIQDMTFITGVGKAQQIRKQHLLPTISLLVLLATLSTRKIRQRPYVTSFKAFYLPILIRHWCQSYQNGPKGLLSLKRTILSSGYGNNSKMEVQSTLDHLQFVTTQVLAR